MPRHDAVTRVDPASSYRVRAATEHPIEEHQRVRLFRAILAGGDGTEESRTLLGEPMYEAHASFSACGLGAIRRSESRAGPSGHCWETGW